MGTDLTRGEQARMNLHRPFIAVAERTAAPQHRASPEAGSANYVDTELLQIRSERSLRFQIASTRKSASRCQPKSQKHEESRPVFRVAATSPRDCGSRDRSPNGAPALAPCDQTLVSAGDFRFEGFDWSCVPIRRV